MLETFEVNKHKRYDNNISEIVVSENILVLQKSNSMSNHPWHVSWIFLKFLPEVGMLLKLENHENLSS